MQPHTPISETPVYDDREQFLAFQLSAYIQHGSFISPTVIVPSQTWPANLFEITRLLDRLRAQARTEFEYLVSVSDKSQPRQFEIEIVAGAARAPVINLHIV